MNPNEAVMSKDVACGITQMQWTTLLRSRTKYNGSLRISDAF